MRVITETLGLLFLSCLIWILLIAAAIYDIEQKQADGKIDQERVGSLEVGR